MKVLQFFDEGRKKGKFFMSLLLTFPEKMALAKAGGFDKAIGSEGWIEREALAGSLKFPDREAYVFHDRRERLDYIYHTLAEKLEWKANIRNIFSTPSLAQLLAKNHLATEAGMLNLYIDHDLPLRDQRRRMLWATYRAKGPVDYEKFWAECSGMRGYVRAEFRTPDVIVTRGFFESGYAWLQSFLNKYENFSLKTNVLDAEKYPILLLRSVL